MSAITRILEFIAEKKLSKREFYAVTGLSNGFLDKVNSIGSDKLENILTAYPEISVEWLVTGKGSMFLKTAPNPAPNIAPNPKMMVVSGSKMVNRPFGGGEVENGNQEVNESDGKQDKKVMTMPRVITIDTNGEENVIYVPIKARAGYLTGYSDANFIEKLPAFRLPGFRNGTFRIFEIDGLSMFSTLHDHDKVIARWSGISDIRDDRIYVLVTKNEGILVKRVINRFQDGKLICKSDNNHKGEYPPIVLDINEIKEVWYAVEVWSRQLSQPGEVYKRIVDLEGDVALMKDAFKKLNLTSLKGT